MRTTSGPATSIERLTCTYLVPADHRDPAPLAARLDAVAGARLAGTLADALDAALDPADPSVWVIDRLELSVSLPGDVDDLDLLARLWARGIADRIAAVVAGALDLPGVRRFPHRAGYLAAFAAALAAGDAHTRWEYATFAGLAAAPPGQALVGAAGALGVPVLDVIEVLARTRRLDSVLDRLGAAAAPLWRALMPAAAPAVAVDAPTLAAVWARRAVLAGRPDPSGPVARLRLLGVVRAGTGRALDPQRLVAAVDQVVSLLDRFPSADVPDSAVPPGLGPLVARPQWTDPWSDIPAAGDSATPAAPEPASPTSLVCPYAGVLLIVPDLLAAGLSPAPEAAEWRLRVLARCLGARLAAEALDDAALRLIAGVPPPGPRPGIPVVPGLPTPSPSDAAFLGADPAGAVIALLAHAGVRLFAQHLAGFGNASLEHLHTNVYGVPGTVTVRPELIDVALEPAPLQVLLDLAGLDELVCPLPWLGADLVVRQADR
ncbi:hypothetical protein [Paractinoplanes globisporus]|uniref:Uncharacterized protein n=1 Tax=Paractinoplanes globisporus TaxID=113565 RepID=A0ABW6W6T3_9ACTN|nr:hypothetical protein [Actinoplanes globisporus]